MKFIQKSYYRKSQPTSVGKSLLKLGLGLLVLGAPVLVLLLIFKPFVEKKNVERAVIHHIDYRLPDGYAQKDVSEQVKKMSDDSQYLFYFYAIEKEDIIRATREVYEILDRARNQELLLAEMGLLQKKTQSLATMFYHLDYTDEYTINPSEYPDLQKVLNKFLFEEFKLAILGVCYKATYDEKFRFNWDKTSRSAARKLHGILLKKGGGTSE